MKIKILATVLLSATLVSATEKSNFTFSVAYGSHPVGFRLVQQYDYTRSYKRVDTEGNLIKMNFREGVASSCQHPRLRARTRNPRL
jgi:hypothetical protein